MPPGRPRRTCPACARRYAGLVDPECPICHGLGVLTLGAGALHHYDPPAVARSVELYLEHAAQHARATLPLAGWRFTLEAAADQLRHAGILAAHSDDAGTPAHDPRPADPAAAPVVELDAHRATRQLTHTPVTAAVLNGLAAPPLTTLTPDVRPREAPPTASANGHRSSIAVIADPIDPLGPDTAALNVTRRGTDHRGTVIAASVNPTVRRKARP